MILDGNSIVNRAFYGVRMLNAPDGTPTNAIFGFLNILQRMLDEQKPDALCVAFDRKEPTFRHKAYEGYKAQRKPMPEELAVQMPLLKETLDATPDAEKAEKFAEIAKEKSDCPSGSKGGDLGFFTHGQMVKEFDEAAFSLPIGTISDVVKTQFGLHLILVTDKKEAAAAEGDKPAEPESVKASHILVKAPAERPVPDVKDVEKSLKNRGESEEISKFMKDILSNSGIKAADEYKHMLP